MTTRLAAILAVCILVPVAAVAQIRDLTGEPLPPPVPGQGFAGKPKVDPKTVPGQHIQDAWTTIKDDSEEAVGVLEVEWNPRKTPRAVLREGTTTTVTLPAQEQIIDHALGDQTNFDYKPVADAPNKMWVWVKNPGYDTTLTLIGRSGTEYPVYMRGTRWNAPEIPHLVVRYRTSAPGFRSQGQAGQPAAKSGPLTGPQQESIQALTQSFPEMKPEWVRKGCLFDPTKIRHDRVLKGDSPEIAPVWIYRDDCFTYADWGRKRKWSAVSRVIDGHNQDVTFDKSRDGRFQIIHTTEPLIFRLGEKWVCVVAEE